MIPLSRVQNRQNSSVATETRWLPCRVWWLEGMLGFWGGVWSISVSSYNLQFVHFCLWVIPFNKACTNNRTGAMRNIWRNWGWMVWGRGLLGDVALSLSIWKWVLWKDIHLCLYNSMEENRPHSGSQWGHGDAGRLTWGGNRRTFWHAELSKEKTSVAPCQASAVCSPVETVNIQGPPQAQVQWPLLSLCFLLRGPCHIVRTLNFPARAAEPRGPDGPGSNPAQLLC